MTAGWLAKDRLSMVGVKALRLTEDLGRPGRSEGTPRLTSAIPVDIYRIYSMG